MNKEIQYSIIVILIFIIRGSIVIWNVYDAVDKREIVLNKVCNANGFSKYTDYDSNLNAWVSINKTKVECDGQYIVTVCANLTCDAYDKWHSCTSHHYDYYKNNSSGECD